MKAFYKEFYRDNLRLKKQKQNQIKLDKKWESSNVKNLIQMESMSK